MKGAKWADANPSKLSVRRRKVFCLHLPVCNASTLKAEKAEGKFAEYNVNLIDIFLALSLWKNIKSVFFLFFF